MRGQRVLVRGDRGVVGDDELGAVAVARGGHALGQVFSAVERLLGGHLGVTFRMEPLLLRTKKDSRSSTVPVTWSRITGREFVTPSAM